MIQLNCVFGLMCFIWEFFDELTFKRLLRYYFETLLCVVGFEDML